LIRKVFLAINPEFYLNGGLIFLFFFSSLGFWYLLLKYWEKIEYRGSFEWLLGRLKGKKDVGKGMLVSLYEPIPLQKISA